VGCAGFRRWVGYAAIASITTLTPPSRTAHDQRERTTVRIGVPVTPIQSAGVEPSNPRPSKYAPKRPGGLRVGGFL
jgi:hypothetical protein